MNPFLIGIVTPQLDKRSCITYKSVLRYSTGDYDLKVKFNNTSSLTSSYNEMLKHADINNYNQLFLVHDDIELRQNLSDFDFNGFTVAGLAGANNVTIKSPFLWHLSAPREGHLGAVAHGDGKDYIITSFGPFNRKAVLVDGVFIAIDMVKWRDNPVYFDENIPTPYHFYDISFSLDCNLKKVSVGVVDFPITHRSPGLNKGFEEWKVGESYILNKYSKYLNKTLQA